MAGCACQLGISGQVHEPAGTTGQVGSSLTCAGPRMPLLYWPLAFTAAVGSPVVQFKSMGELRPYEAYFD